MKKDSRKRVDFVVVPLPSLQMHHDEGRACSRQYDTLRKDWFEPEWIWIPGFHSPSHRLCSGGDKNWRIVLWS